MTVLYICPLRVFCIQLAESTSTKGQRMNTSREQLASRLGFLLLSAGCAIGLGNVWRFPFIAGQYGGAVFLAAYFFFLFAVGLPILIMEFSMGRAAQKSWGRAFNTLEKPGSCWNKLGIIGGLGPFILMMFYIPVASWLVAYCYHTASGALAPLDPKQVGEFFSTMLSEPWPMYGWSMLVIVLGIGSCMLGLQKGVERIVKFLMLGLLALLLILAFHSLTLSGASEGLSFYLAPDFARAQKAGLLNLLNDAMNQAFFTISVGIGSMMIFGSYLSKERSLTSEATYIIGLDTFVALMAGIIIFPACFTFGVEPNAGPALIFITLPNIFNSMGGGNFWGLLFFIFMACAALTTVIAVFEAIIAYLMDVHNMTRTKANIVTFVAISLGVLPCILGFNLWAHIQPLGKGSSILDLEDFIISQNLLPLGSLAVLIFCTSRYGWGFDNFSKEADAGEGRKFPAAMRLYLAYVLPLIILFVFAQGYIKLFK